MIRVAGFHRKEGDRVFVTLVSQQIRFEQREQDWQIVDDDSSSSFLEPSMIVWAGPVAPTNQIRALKLLTECVLFQALSPQSKREDVLLWQAGM